MTGERIDPRAKLEAIVAAFRGQRFAVIDGGHFEDLPASLRRERLFARSLYLDQVDAEVRKAGPWLVSLDQAPEATGTVLALVGYKPAVVFWCCDKGEAVLYRHLRSICMARIPAWAADGQLKPVSSNASRASTSVFFRHFDPRVLGAMLPCLDASQFSRFLGPAEEAAFLTTEYSGARRIVRQQDWPPAAAGVLTIRSEQIEALGNRRLDASRQRIAAYLRDAACEDAGRLSDEDLWRTVVRSEESGRSLGLTTERAQAKWAYLMLTTRGEIDTSPGVRAYLQAPNKVPDQQMDLFMRSLIAARERMGDPQ